MGEQRARETQPQGNPLAVRILADAEAEATRLAREAQEAAQARLAQAREEAERLEREARAEAERRMEAIRRNAQSRLVLAIRREQLRATERIVDEALALVRDRLASMVGTPAYRAVLVGWIAEAAIGLGESEAEVNASAAERAMIDEVLLAEAEQEVARETGRNVKLTLSEAQPLLGQGVVLTSRDGRIAYNNQVSTRLLREQGRVRAMVHEYVFRAKGDGERG